MAQQINKVQLLNHSNNKINLFLKKDKHFHRADSWYNILMYPFFSTFFLALSIGMQLFLGCRSYNFTKLFIFLIPCRWDLKKVFGRKRALWVKRLGNPKLPNPSSIRSPYRFAKEICLKNYAIWILSRSVWFL